MLEESKEALEQLSGTITKREIQQQPELWEETFSIYQERREYIKKFLNSISNKHNHIRILFTGAGTSAFVGETVAPYVKERIDETKWEVSSVPTTSVVSNPYQFLKKEIPTLLISFARSGNSPESVATVNLAKDIVDDLYQMTITCAADGKLAKAAEGDEKNLLILMPERSNDQGFAMTGSYTCMTLTTLLIFGDLKEQEEKQLVNQVIAMGNDVLKRDREVEKLMGKDFKRIIYLGSGSLEGLAREAQLKVLELTAGEIVTAYDSSLGFRHGPKSFVGETALLFLFVSNNPYTRRYDVDMLNELKKDGIAKKVVALQVDGQSKFKGDSFQFDKEGQILPDAFLALPYIIFGQLVSLIASVQVGNKPDDPSPTGTVNRIVKGVTLYEYNI